MRELGYRLFVMGVARWEGSAWRNEGGASWLSGGDKRGSV